jgi:nicotinamidase/pyrazinamidase
MSFASNNETRIPGDVIDLGGIPQVLWPDHCVQDSYGAEFHSGLDLTHVTRVFRKGTDPDIDSYSAFFDNAHRKATGLGEYLREQSVTDVYLLGLATDYCVKFSALDALDLGFRVYVVEDGTRGVNVEPGDVANAIDEMKNSGVQFVNSADLR